MLVKRGLPRHTAPMMGACSGLVANMDSLAAVTKDLRTRPYLAWLSTIVVGSASTPRPPLPLHMLHVHLLDLGIRSKPGTWAMVSAGLA